MAVLLATPGSFCGSPYFTCPNAPGAVLSTKSHLPLPLPRPGWPLDGLYQIAQSKSSLNQQERASHSLLRLVGFWGPVVVQWRDNPPFYLTRHHKKVRLKTNPHQVHKVFSIIDLVVAEHTPRAQAEWNLEPPPIIFQEPSLKPRLSPKTAFQL